MLLYFSLLPDGDDGGGGADAIAYAFLFILPELKVFPLVNESHIYLVFKSLHVLWSSKYHMRHVLDKYLQRLSSFE